MNERKKISFHVKSVSETYSDITLNKQIEVFVNRIFIDSIPIVAGKQKVATFDCKITLPTYELTSRRIISMMEKTAIRYKKDAELTRFSSNIDSIKTYGKPEVIEILINELLTTAFKFSLKHTMVNISVTAMPDTIHMIVNFCFEKSSDYTEQSCFTHFENKNSGYLQIEQKIELPLGELSHKLPEVDNLKNDESNNVNHVLIEIIIPKVGQHKKSQNGID